MGDDEDEHDENKNDENENEDEEEDEEDDEAAGNADQSWRCGNTSIKKPHNKTKR